MSQNCLNNLNGKMPLVSRTNSSNNCANNANNINNLNSFNFPDGGWVCSQCQNYNFSGRVKCNRCSKIKTKQDFNGKPKHLLKKSGTLTGTGLLEG
jgi:hypothetical protein